MPIVQGAQPQRPESLLAIYGAIVGTVALLLNIVRFGYDRRKDNVQLSVEAAPDIDLQAHIARLSGPMDAMDSSTLLPGFKVTVFNRGLVAAHVRDAGIIDSDGRDVGALCHRAVGNFMVLSSIPDSNLDPIAPKSSRTFDVYLRRGISAPEPTKSFVVDRTGKRWTGKFRGGSK